MAARQGKYICERLEMLDSERNRVKKGAGKWETAEGTPKSEKEEEEMQLGGYLYISVIKQLQVSYFPYKSSTKLVVFVVQQKV